MSLETCSLQLVPKLGYQILWGLCSIPAALHNTGDVSHKAPHVQPFLAYGDLNYICCMRGLSKVKSVEAKMWMVMEAECLEVHALTTGVLRLVDMMCSQVCVGAMSRLGTGRRCWY